MTVSRMLWLRGWERPRAAPTRNGGDLVRDRRARERNAEGRELPAARRLEREVRDVQAALVEDRARREVEPVVTRVSPVTSDELTTRRQHLDLVRLVGADVEVALRVELDAVRAVERLRRVLGRVDRGAVREDRDRARAAVLVHDDAQDAVVRGVGDVQEALRAVEGDAV